MEIKINDQSEFPDHTPVLVWYPPPGADDHDQRTWAWLPGSILSQCGPDEWHVVIEVPELAEPDPPDDARALRNIPACAGPTPRRWRRQLLTPAQSIQVCWPEIQAFIHTGTSNARHEGLNRVIKLEARQAYGFPNPTNQRLRSRCATTRASRNRAIPA
jgi:hypothetical protein